MLVWLFQGHKEAFTVLETFTRTYPTLPVVILSASNQAGDIQQSIDSGAMGYIPKDTPRSEMLNALRLILSGRIYLPAELSSENLVTETTLP